MHTKNILKFIKYYGKNKKLGIFCFLIISFFAGCLEFVGIGLIYPFVLMMIQPESITNTIYYAYLIKFTGVQNVLINTFIIGFAAIMMFVLKNIFMMINLYLQNKFVTGWKNDINNMLMNYYLFAPYKTILHTSISEKIYNLTTLSMQTLEIYVMRYLVYIVNAIIVLMILCFLSINLPFVIFPLLLFLFVSVVIMNKIFKNKTEKLSNITVKTSVENNNQVIENVRNLKEIRICESENYFLNKFKEKQKANNEVIFKNNYYASIPPYVVEIIIVMALLILAVLITIENSGQTTKIIAWCAIVVAAIFRMAPPINKMQMALNHMNASKSLLEKMINEYETYHFDEISTIEDDDIKLEFNHRISLEEINFSYEEEKPVIKDLTLIFPKGEFVGIVGESGSGKSTLADILMGLLPIESGKITIDEQEINKEETGILRKLIGYVPQQMNILEDTFKKNVAWGEKDSLINDEKVSEALKKAQLYDFVMSKKDGINAMIGGGFSGLSQGQKQRLLIARALYKNSEILIFDEATSSLDVKTENEITQMLSQLKGEKTIIAIAHRLSTLKICDWLVWLKDGKVVDVGTFEQLSERNVEFENLIKISKM